MKCELLGTVQTLFKMYFIQQGCIKSSSKDIYNVENYSISNKILLF